MCKLGLRLNRKAYEKLYIEPSLINEVRLNYTRENVG